MARFRLFASQPPPRPLAGQTAVITGAGSGIGRALAIRLSAHGCPVAIVDAGAETLEETAAMLSGPALTRQLDVRDRQGQFAFAADVAAWAQTPIGAVFNNAGVGVSATVADASPEDDEWLLSVNVDGVINGVRAFLPLLLEQRSGSIVNTSSVFGLAGIPYQSAYCASKFAVRGFTESLRHELVGTGVRAATVHPGGVKTNIARNARIHADPRGLDRTHEQIAAEFEAITRTTPERAAEIIHRGVDAGKARILVGPDAYVFDVLTRIAPTNYFRILSKVEPFRSMSPAGK
ncbi:MAG TPA: SDR family NAD(P)-dependent oxidoreductase [Solirubrobacteraceae bacterium]|nr:SDR family NAD(P)-dependent oxidoreductase [Solirubrobacteraceae bacterium]